MPALYRSCGVQVHSLTGSHRGPVLLRIAELYRVEDKAPALSSVDRLLLRKLESKPNPEKPRAYLIEVQLVVSLVDLARNKGEI